MGYIQHNPILVTGTCGMHIVRLKALAIFGDVLVSELVSSGVNDIKSFFVAPDGSKEGWEAAEIGVLSATSSLSGWKPVVMAVRIMRYIGQRFGMVKTFLPNLCVVRMKLRWLGMFDITRIFPQNLFVVRMKDNEVNQMSSQVVKLTKINVTVSEDAKRVLLDYKDQNVDLHNLDSALEALLIEFGDKNDEHK